MPLAFSVSFNVYDANRDGEISANELKDTILALMEGLVGDSFHRVVRNLYVLFRTRCCDQLS